MRRLNPRPATRAGDSGAVAALVAVLVSTGLLFGLGAVTVDLGQVYAERRQVQNGADAAALAVAADCATRATCDTSSAGRAKSLADANAADGRTSVLGVCGSGRATLAPCTGTGDPALATCPASPSGVRGYARVRTGTLTAGGSTLLPAAFVRALTGRAGSGTAVRACAIAAWGVPAGLDDVLPLTISECEWLLATANGTTFVADGLNATPLQEVALKLHSTTDRTGCASVGGAFADLPGGFGWLAANSACRAAVTNGGNVAADPGVSASGCAGDAVAGAVGTVIHLPIYEAAWGSGSGGTYRIAGFAAFHLSGYYLPGAHPNKVASPVGGNLCRGSDKCVYGWFTQALVPGGGALGNGTDFGSRVVALTG
ncbi:pilus assembly protein TadG-related protein [Spongisporangium articulatum]|uniref:Pilus assembly protein TadG-related protein n=1 Tax=Spongisporangium articulatum TaxID=3362603 RepID=A0ABW8AIA8_9ACTN